MACEGYGSFGANATMYTIARRGFPDLVFDHLQKRSNHRKRVLDMGCGTGTSSRQLADRGFVVTGCDIDGRMVEQAQIESVNYAIEYIEAPANRVSRDDRSFEVITAFSSFHWFCDDSSVSELRRLLRDRGLLFVVNKNDHSEIRTIIRDVVRAFSPPTISGRDAKRNYYPDQILEYNGFDDIQEFTCLAVEKYSVQEALLYAQSTSVWNLVAEEFQGRAADAVARILESHARNGFVEQRLEIKAVSGYR